jgi:hypothetical protein
LICPQCTLPDRALMHSDLPFKERRNRKLRTVVLQSECGSRMVWVWLQWRTR